MRTLVYGLTVAVGFLFCLPDAKAAVIEYSIYIFDGWCTDCPNEVIEKKAAKKVDEINKKVVKKATKEKPDGEVDEEEEEDEDAPKESVKKKAEKESLVEEKKAKQAEKRKVVAGEGSQAEGVLVLQNYTDGEVLTRVNFVSFTYTSTIYPGSLVVTQADLVDPPNGGIAGSLPAELPNPATLTFVWSVEVVEMIDEVSTISTLLYSFSTDSFGDWLLATSSDNGQTWVPNDIGIDGTWGTAAVPEPASLALLGLGLGGLLFGRRRAARRSIASA